MAGEALDEAFARHANQLGIATIEQIENARAAQAESAKSGVLISLAEVLVNQGVLTPAMRENIEKKLKAMQEGGLSQLGNYKLLKKLGEGGMGAVYLADDTIAMRKVALKVLPRKYASDSEFLTRFRREAKAAGKLNHVNIVGAFTVGEELGNHFYVMEYCEGEPLDNALKRQLVLPWDKATEITIQVARGLQHAHAHGFIHRDIKPANIFITAEGIAKILDLGLSKNIADSEQSFNTQTGVAMGTPHYISPEQARGDKGIDGRTDIYSLGATLYHLVTGQTPFQGSTAAMIMMKHLSEQLPNPQDIREDIPDAVVQVIQKMMAKEPADRYADCSALLADLELVIVGKSPSSHAIDVGKSSIAMRRAVRNATDDAASRMRRSGTGGHPPVGARKQVAEDRRSGGRRSEDQPAKSPFQQPLYIGGAIAGLAALIVVVALMMRGGPSPSGDGNQSATVDIKLPASVASGNPIVKTAPPSDAGASKKVDDAWIKSVQSLQPDEQIKQVVEKLKLLNPSYTGVQRHINSRGVVVDLDLMQMQIRDISPLKALRGLKSLRLQSTQVSDLTPLSALSLEELNVAGTPVTNLAPIQEMPLKNLHCPFDAARDGVLLRSIKTLERINGVSVAEFWAKNGAPNTINTPNVEKAVPAARASNVLIYETFETFDLKSLPAGWTINSPSDFSIVPDGNGKALRVNTPGGDKRFTSLQYNLDIEKVRGRTIRVAAKVKCPQGYTPHTTTWAKPNIMAIITTDGRESHRAEYLLPEKTPDWKQLVHLRTIPVTATQVRVGIFLDLVTADVLFDDFSVDLDPGETTPLPGQATPPLRSPGPVVINLLPLIDPVKDSPTGRWQLRGGELLSDATGFARTEIPYQPPEEYDFRIEFTAHGNPDVNQLLSKSGHSFHWMPAGYSNQLSGFAMVGGLFENATTVRKSPNLKSGQRYVSLVQVRNDGVKGFIDDKLVSELKTNYQNLAPLEPARMSNPAAIGVLSHQCPTTFHKIEVIELTGAGKFTRPDDPAVRNARNAVTGENDGWSKAIDLLALADVSKDAVKGVWRSQDGGVISDETGAVTSGTARLELPYHVPEEYDVRVDFTRLSGRIEVGLTLSKSGVPFVWKMDNDVHSYQFEGLKNTPVLNRRAALVNGRAYTALVQVRNTGVKAFIDGVLYQEIKTDFARGQLFEGYKLRNDNALGVLSWSSPTKFTRIEVLEVTGKGRFSRPDAAARNAEKLRTGNQKAGF